MATENASTSSSSSSSLGGVIATITRVCYLAFLAILLTWIGKLPSPWFAREKDDVLSFNFHPLCMGIAFVVLMPEALLAYADLEERRGVSHAASKNVHAALNGGAALLLALGLVAIFTNHAGHAIPPLYSAHSWLGVATAALMGCQATAGAAVYLIPARPTATSLGAVGGGVGGSAWSTWPVGSETRAVLMPWHRFFGATTLVLGVATCCMGFVEKQGFTKCAPDPTYKFCPQLQLANVLAALATSAAALAVGAVYARRRAASGEVGVSADDDPNVRAALLRRRRDADSDD